MRIIVTHVTRMSEGFCCVAGVTEQGYRHVRPVTGARLPSTLLQSNGGIFDMGAVVDLGETQPAGEPPEVEDRLFDPKQAKLRGQLSPGKLWQVLKNTASEDLNEIFGPGLRVWRQSRTVEPGQGSASLGCYRPLSGGQLEIQERDGRIRVVLPGENLNLSLTDARFTDEHHNANKELVAVTNRAMQEGAELLLGVGLTRPFSPGGRRRRLHWLQANAVHIGSNPGLRLPRPGRSR